MDVSEYLHVFDAEGRARWFRGCLRDVATAFGRFELPGHAALLAVGEGAS